MYRLDVQPAASFVSFNSDNKAINWYTYNTIDIGEYSIRIYADLP